MYFFFTLSLLLSPAFGCSTDFLVLNGYKMSSFVCPSSQKSVIPIVQTPQECANHCTLNGDGDCVGFTWDYGCSADHPCYVSPFYRCSVENEYSRCRLYSNVTCLEDVDPGDGVVVYEKSDTNDPMVIPDSLPLGFSRVGFRVCDDSVATFLSKSSVEETVEHCADSCRQDAADCFAFMFLVSNAGSTAVLDDDGLIHYMDQEARCVKYTAADPEDCSVTRDSSNYLLFMRNYSVSVCLNDMDCPSNTCVDGVCTSPQYSESIKFSGLYEPCNLYSNEVSYVCGEGSSLTCSELSNRCVQYGKRSGEECVLDGECDVNLKCQSNWVGRKTCGGSFVSKNNIVRFFKTV